MDATIITAIAGALGVIIGGFITLRVAAQTNEHQRRLQREQWEHEDQKNRQLQAQKEAQEAIQHTIEIYGDALENLSSSLQSSSLSIDMNRKTIRSLLLVATNHYDKTSPEYTRFILLFGHLQKGLNHFLGDLIELVNGFVENDPRLK